MQYCRPTFSLYCLYCLISFLNQSCGLTNRSVSVCQETVIAGQGQVLSWSSVPHHTAHRSQLVADRGRTVPVCRREPRTGSRSHFNTGRWPFTNTWMSCPQSLYQPLVFQSTECTKQSQQGYIFFKFFPQADAPYGWGGVQWVRVPPTFWSWALALSYSGASIPPPTTMEYPPPILAS